MIPVHSGDLVIGTSKQEIFYRVKQQVCHQKSLWTENERVSEQLKSSSLLARNTLFHVCVKYLRYVMKMGSDGMSYAAELAAVL